MMKRITLVLVLFTMALAVNAQKFGHITAEALLSVMPEYDSAQVKLADLNKTYEGEIERIQVEINKKIEEFQNTMESMSELMKETKASEIQELQARLQNFAQTAQQDLQQQQMTLIQPVMEKARLAISDVAKELGLLYVFDMSQGNPVYASEESVDMLPLVKAKLGL